MGTQTAGTQTAGTQTVGTTKSTGMVTTIKSHSSIGAIAGGLAGGLLLLGGLIGLIKYYSHRRRQGHTENQISSGVEFTRRAGQRQIEERIRMVQRELDKIASDLGHEETVTRPQIPCRQIGLVSPGSNIEVVDEQVYGIQLRREQLTRLRGQITFLRTRQNSPWAQDLSDNAPPEYGSIFII